MNKTAINRTSLKEQISEIILNRIFEGELKPGDRLKELAIAKEFGTSQAPVREALRSLESQGYLRHKTHSGTTVILLEAKEIKEINQIREAMEIQALTDGLTTIQETVYRLDEINDRLPSGNETQVMTDDEHFHKIILEAYDNERMMELWQTLTNKLRISRSRLNESNLIDQIPVLDDSILQAIKSGNTRKATQQLKQYYVLWNPANN
ncbi:MAG TPA: GntR family transcriptional regulator [Balneolales bacterium]|nr:GntR family transcriptional regulator [Balneolales bacterium]